MKLKSLSLNEPATRATRQVTEWLRRPEQRDVAPAIVIADFVETDDCDFIKTVIRRNYE